LVAADFSEGDVMGKIENPPAFPVAPILPDVREGSDGMTLRDWFAGQALAGLCANSAYLDLLPQTGRDSAVVLSEVAVNIADAMLATRQQERGHE
jgi:hypothetical protein